jgi:type II secretory pathway pseudopilin PulG
MTLVELLVVIAILGVMLALILPAIQSVRAAARRLQCTNNLHQIGLALQTYHEDHKHFPVGSHRHRQVQIAWSAFLLPYLEQGSVFDRLDIDSPYVSEKNRDAAAERITVYLCPSTETVQRGRENDRIRMPHETEYIGRGATDYAGIFGSGMSEPIDNGILLYNRTVRMSDVHDGLTHTIVVAEDTGRGFMSEGQWINGGNVMAVEVAVNTRQDNEIFSDHPGGAYVLAAGGSVHFLSNGTDVDVLSALCTRDEGDDSSGGF